MHCVVTLAERNYFYGACVLYNSLIRNGFDGRFVVGYRDRHLLPQQPLAAMEREAGRIHLVELNTRTHFTNYKPVFMRQVLASFTDCTAITYIDPDIVVNALCPWILSWCEGGPAACADVNWWMPAQHPTRREWLKITGLITSHNLDLYFNGGFLSILRSHSGFLDLWQKLIEDNEDIDCPLNVQGEIGSWRKDGRSNPFMAIDQDALNLALMHWQGPITTLGPDVMGFNGYPILPHAVGDGKPWARSYIRGSFLGKPPRVVDKLYWKYADRPLLSCGKRSAKWKSLTLKLASLIGRFYRRR